MLTTYRQLIITLIADATTNDRPDMAAAFETVRDVLDMETLEAETVFALIIGKVTLPAVLSELAEGYLDSIGAADLDDADVIADAQEAAGEAEAEDTRNIAGLAAALFDAAAAIANF